LPEPKLFRLKKKQLLSDYFDFFEKSSALKKPEFNHLASNQPNWQPGCSVSMIP